MFSARARPFVSDPRAPETTTLDDPSEAWSKEVLCQANRPADDWLINKRFLAGRPQLFDSGF